MTNDKNNLYRISVLLYSETEGIKRKDTIIKKVIEAAFVENGNQAMTLSEIVVSIKEKFDMTFVMEEIDEILSNKKWDTFQRISDQGVIKVNLCDKRYETLHATSEKNIGAYIDEFVQLEGVEPQIGEVIYSYLYQVFQKSIKEFKSVIDGKNISIANMSEEDIGENGIYVNKFLQWNNPEKDRALVALQGYALEYSMLTCDSDVLFGTRLGDIFSNKSLYIDTNIIYYCLGINGEEYKIANDNLLEKCKACNEKLVITKYTDEEFRNTLDHYIEEIKKYDSETISRLNYRHYMKNEDIYMFYLDWKKTRTTFKEPKYFKAFMLSQYEEWKKKYGIVVEAKAPYNEEQRENVEVIDFYSQEIPYHGKINYDAINVFWIEQLRGKGNGTSKFQSTKQFIVSPHKALKRWDADREQQVPVIVSPSIWMTLLSRFVSRNNNDYICFKNFININLAQENVYTNKEFFSIVQAIENVTDDLEQQESIIDVFVEEKFSFLRSVAKDDMDIEEIQNRVQVEATKIVDKKIAELSDQVESLRTQLTLNKEDKENEQVLREEYRKELLQKNNLINERDDELEKEKNKNKILVENIVKKKLLKRRIISLIEIIIPSLLYIWQMWDMFIKKNPDNYFSVLIVKLLEKTILQDSIADVAIIIIPFILLGCIGGIVKNRLKIFYDAEEIQRFEEKIKISIQQ